MIHDEVNTMLRTIGLPSLQVARQEPLALKIQVGKQPGAGFISLVADTAQHYVVWRYMVKLNGYFVGHTESWLSQVSNLSYHEQMARYGFRHSWCFYQDHLCLLSWQDINASSTELEQRLEQMMQRIKEVGGYLVN